MTESNVKNSTSIPLMDCRLDKKGGFASLGNNSMLISCPRPPVSRPTWEVLDGLEDLLLVLLPRHLQLLHVDQSSPPPPGRPRLPLSLRDGGQVKPLGSVSVSLTENISLRTTIVLSEIPQPLIFQCLKWFEASCVRGSVLEGNEGIFTSWNLPA